MSHFHLLDSFSLPSASSSPFHYTHSWHLLSHHLVVLGIGHLPISLTQYFRQNPPKLPASNLQATCIRIQCVPPLGKAHVLPPVLQLAWPPFFQEPRIFHQLSLSSIFSISKHPIPPIHLCTESNLLFLTSLGLTLNPSHPTTVFHLGSML